jgi:alkylation response protein AidB-like acyl-CoA dehydrogenase
MLQALSPDQALFRDATTRLLDDRVPLSHLRRLRDDPAGFEPAYWTAGAELGWTSLLVSEEDGGGSLSGEGLVDLTLVAYEFGHHVAPGPLVDTNIVCAALTGHGGDLHKTALRELLSGAAVACCCVGAPPWRPDRDATLDVHKDGGDVVINGVARPVESAGQADHLLVTGRSDRGKTQVLVPRAASGVTVKPLKSIDVTRRLAEVRFDDVRAPISAVLGEVGGADDEAARQMRLACVILTAESVGAMDAAFAMTLQWAFDRYTFGRPLAAYQALKHRFADMKSWLEASHAVSDAAAAAVAGQAADAADMASAAKAYVGEYGVELAQQCVQMHGGIGLTYEHDLHFYLRRITLDRTLYGAPADHRQLLAATAVQREEAA